MCAKKKRKKKKMESMHWRMRINFRDETKGHKKKKKKKRDCESVSTYIIYVRWEYRKTMNILKFYFLLLSWHPFFFFLQVRGCAKIISTEMAKA